MDDKLLEIKSECDDGFAVEFEVMPINIEIDKRRQQISEGLLSLDELISAKVAQIEELDKNIDKLTNHADKEDYVIAVISGIIAGLLDSFFVGELGLFENASDSAKEKFREKKGNVNDSVNRFIEEYAKQKGYDGNGRLKGVIEFLEKKYPVEQDNIWKGRGISSAKTHHLDDLAHHPSILGLLAAIMVQYLRISVFSNKSGEVEIVFVPPKKEDLFRIIVPVMISGVIKWLVNLAEKNEILLFDENVPVPIQNIVRNLHRLPIAIEILRTVDNWFGHLVSDMGGSKSTSGGGAGLPGIFLSLLKEIAMLPGVNHTELPQIINDLYQNTKDSPLTDKLDLRTELTVVNEQAMPVIFNEVIVRSLFLVRHILIESKDKNSISEINWSRVVPLGNRTIVRMMTIASGTFVAVDAADAAIRTAVEHPEACANLPMFLGTMIMRINFVGIGRFTIAVATDVGMGIKRTVKMSERSKEISELTMLYNSKMYFRGADLFSSMGELYEAQEQIELKTQELWKQVEHTEKSMCELYKAMEYSVMFFTESIDRMNSDFETIEESINELELHNPGLKSEMLNHISHKRRTRNE